MPRMALVASKKDRTPGLSVVDRRTLQRLSASPEVVREREAVLVRRIRAYLREELEANEVLVSEAALTRMVEQVLATAIGEVADALEAEVEALRRGHRRAH